MKGDNVNLYKNGVDMGGDQVNLHRLEEKIIVELETNS
jgi:hypothetical protein